MAQLKNTTVLMWFTCHTNMKYQSLTRGRREKKNLTLCKEIIIINVLSIKQK